MDQGGLQLDGRRRQPVSLARFRLCHGPTLTCFAHQQGRWSSECARLSPGFLGKGALVRQPEARDHRRPVPRRDLQRESQTHPTHTPTQLTLSVPPRCPRTRPRLPRTHRPMPRRRPQSHLHSRPRQVLPRLRHHLRDAADAGRVPVQHAQRQEHRAGDARPGQGHDAHRGRHQCADAQGERRPEHRKGGFHLDRDRPGEPAAAGLFDVGRAGRGYPAVYQVRLFPSRLQPPSILTLPLPAPRPGPTRSKITVSGGS